MANNNQRWTTGTNRRTLMKAMGAGTAVGVFGGVASADEHDADPDDDEEPTADEPTYHTGTVHTVRTLIRESTDPGRPADFFFEPTGLHIEPGDVIRFVFETPDHTVTSYHPAFGMQRRLPPGVQPISSPIMGWDPASLPPDIDMPPEPLEAPADNGPPDEDETDEADDDDGIDVDEENDDIGEEDDSPPDDGDELNEDEADEHDDADEESEDDDELAPEETPPETAEEGPRPSAWLYGFETPGVYDFECAPHEAFGMVFRVVVGDRTETAFETTTAEELPPPRVGPVQMAREVLTDSALEPEAIVEAGRVEWMDLELHQETAEADPEDDSDEEEEETDTDQGLNIL